jgi:predicted RNA-binding Zn-ribbon protein involved in translation (DUF1610 family)
MTVIDLGKAREERSPHLSGPAHCLSCNHEWQAVAPVGTVWFDCPNCSLMMGRLANDVMVDEDHWECGCGNTMFYVTPTQIYCPVCGKEQNTGIWKGKQ